MHPNYCSILFALLFVTSTCFSQNIDYGIRLVYNSSAHTNYNPQVAEDGTFQWNALGTYGVGGYVIRPLSLRMDIEVDVIYQQKGYKEIAQVGNWFGSHLIVNEGKFRNTFNYVSSTVILRYAVFTSKTTDYIMQVGLEHNYLLNHKIESDFFPINSFYPVNAYQDRWKKHTLNAVIGIGVEVDAGVKLDFGLNTSLTPVLKASNLVVKDWIWTTRLGLSIPKIFKI